MFAPVLVQFINLFVSVFNVLILARVVLSWVAPASENPLVVLVYDLTEPILGPIRKLVPTAGLDLSPIIAYFLLQGLVYLANRLLLNA
jgi:YggT family protein